MQSQHHDRSRPKGPATVAADGWQPTAAQGPDEHRAGCPLLVRGPLVELRAFRYPLGVRLRSLDLNLLVTLDALLEERSVTVAAQRLDVSQPTMSTALARLRRHFGDELLSRSGNRYDLTPFAARLRPQAAELVAGAERLFAVESAFDPVTAQREFSVVSSDYGLSLVAPALARLVVAGAPRCRLRLLPLTMAALEDVDEALAAVDLLLLPKGVIDGHRHQELLTDEWVGVVATDNTEVAESLTLADLAELPWVVIAGGTSGPAGGLEATPALRQLALLGINPRIAVVTESFQAAPLLVEGTDRVTIVQRRLAERVVSGHGLRIVNLPFPAVPLVEAAWWHSSQMRDGGHRWLRAQLGRLAADFAAAR